MKGKRKCVLGQDCFLTTTVVTGGIYQLGVGHLLFAEDGASTLCARQGSQAIHDCTSARLK